jgi:hypothetical protein
MNFLFSAEKRLQIENKSREFVLEESITNLCATFSKSAEFDEFSVFGGKTVSNRAKKPCTAREKTVFARAKKPCVHYCSHARNVFFWPIIILLSRSRPNSMNFLFSVNFSTPSLSTHEPVGPVKFPCPMVGHLKHLFFGLQPQVGHHL